MEPPRFKKVQTPVGPLTVDINATPEQVDQLVNDMYMKRKAGDLGKKAGELIGQNPAIPDVTMERTAEDAQADFARDPSKLPRPPDLPGQLPPEDIVRANIAGISDEKQRTLAYEDWARKRVAAGETAPWQQSFARAVGQGAALNFADEYEANLGPRLMAPPDRAPFAPRPSADQPPTVSSVLGPSADRAANEAQSLINAQNEQYTKEHPIYSGASNLLGALATAIGTSGFGRGIGRGIGFEPRTTGAPGVGNAVGRGTSAVISGGTMGAAGGATSNIGSRRGTLPERFQDAYQDDSLRRDMGTGAIFGGAAGGAASAIGEGLGAYVRTQYPTGLPQPGVSEAARNLAPGLDEVSMPTGSVAGGADRSPLPFYQVAQDPTVQSRGRILAGTDTTVGRELTAANRRFEDTVGEGTRADITRTTGETDPRNVPLSVGERLKPEYDTARDRLAAGVNTASREREDIVPDDARSRLLGLRQARLALYGRSRGSGVSPDLAGTMRMARIGRKGVGGRPPRGMSWKNLLTARTAIGQDVKTAKATPGRTLTPDPRHRGIQKSSLSEGDVKQLYSGMDRDAGEIAARFGQRGHLERLDQAIRDAYAQSDELEEFTGQRSAEQLVHDLYNKLRGGPTEDFRGAERFYNPGGQPMTLPTQRAMSGAGLARAGIKEGQPLPLTEAASNLNELSPAGRALMFGPDPAIAQRVADISTVGTHMDRGGKTAREAAARAGAEQTVEHIAPRDNKSLGAVLGAIIGGAGHAASALGGMGAGAFLGSMRNSRLRNQLMLGDMSGSIDAARVPAKNLGQAITQGTNVKRTQDDQAKDKTRQNKRLLDKNRVDRNR